MRYDATKEFAPIPRVAGKVHPNKERARQVKAAALRKQALAKRDPLQALGL